MLTRALAIALLLAACGGKSSKSEQPAPEPAQDAPIENVASEEPVEEQPSEELTFSTGNVECDELARRTLCMYDKTPDVPVEARVAFLDGVKYWAEALRNDATRQATIDACKMSIDAGLEGFKALGC